jgi:uncharacterized protein YbgA (DUF1722 family)
MPPCAADSSIPGRSWITPKPPRRSAAAAADAYPSSTRTAALAIRATRGRHANVLPHLAGFMKRDLAPDERAELGEVVDEYRRGLVPLIVPITLLRHHVRRLGQAYLEAQVYLNPHPKELMLRNHV